MDSLLANYASSSDDEDQQEEGKDPKPSSSIDFPPPKSKPSLFSTLPPPKTLAPSSSSSSPSASTTSSSLFSSLPSPKSQLPNPQIDPNPSIEAKESRQKKSIFASLPPPKSQQPSNPNPNPKRVVQFTLPLNPSLLKPDEDDEEEEQQRKPIKDSSSLAPSKGLSSMLPAPKNSLCLAPTAASRRSAFDSSVSSSSNNEERNDFGSKAECFEQERGKIEEFGMSYPAEQGVSGYENYGSYDGNGDGNGVGYVSGYENYGCYDGSWAANGSVDSSYGTGYVSGGGGDYGSYASNWSDVNATVMVAAPVAVPEMERIVGKRGRNEIPAEIVEVNQAELIKNRPREDQVKVTGIAFGPAYQAVSTSKGKPSKLHKRKHQIGSLFFDMKQKEMELAERRAKGFLTKAETQAKYGW